MEYKKMNHAIYLRIDRGEHVVETIREVCEKESIYSGHFQGIGACSKVTMSTYLPEENDFLDHTISGMLEMISLLGNITIGEDKLPFLHSHAVFSYLDEKNKIATVAGHLKEAQISYTGEIVITSENYEIGRQLDRRAGIEVWKLS